MIHRPSAVSRLVLAVSALCGLTHAIDIDTNDPDTLRAACALISDGLMDYYQGNDYGGTVGMFTNPYYWWEAGGAFGSMIDYSFFFNNHTWDNVIIQGMLAQTGTDNNYMPLNQTTTEGNDDQVFWGISAMQAAERNFTNPPAGQAQWLYLAQGVFNTQAWRWDSSSCGGGIRWQIFQWNSGYHYKNTVSNAGLFHMAARLARYTGNNSYTHWAERAYNWLRSVNLVTEGENNGGYYFAYDGASTDDNCSDISAYQWTYNVGMLISGCAYLYNYTEDQVWLTRTEGFLRGATVFFNSTNHIMYEAACQGADTCNNDQRSFKAYFSRFLGATSILAPSTYDSIHTLLVASANGAAQSCSGGSDGHTCGMNWFANGWDNKWGLGEQMAALEVMQNVLVRDRPAPYTARNGGSSTGAGDAGMGTTQQTNMLLRLNGGDRAGAAIITIILGVSIIGLGVYVMM